ncbi:MAG: F0F1 ATP synthase subunit A [Candidatus Omnitrophica bacterium]|nr:F0F1 ATP synthase subunit A [Candidatus Omnitrophota bacterium]MDD5670218.1 F0F1 ATP synthase subunit A [Candidatus Omnitrophota bacterium]
MNASNAVHTLQQAATGNAAAENGHELANLTTLLETLFPDSAWVNFLHHWENVLFSILAAAVIVITAVFAARKNKAVPQGIQNFWETIVETVEVFVTGILGPRGFKHIPFLGTLFVYILLENWSGLIPFMKSPTSAWSTTLAYALITVVYIQMVGIQEQGFWHYLKHMAGSPSGVLGLVLVPLMLIINLTIEFIAVPLSLSLRLFANVSSEDRLLLKFAELNVMFHGIPFLFQLFANILAIAFSIVQAFVFMLLSTVYISLMLPHEESGHGSNSHDVLNQPLNHAHQKV